MAYVPGANEDSPIPPGHPRGSIRTELTIWCGCCFRWEPLESVAGLRIANAEAKERGWKYTKERGWVCPDCQKKKEEEKVNGKV